MLDGVYTKISQMPDFTGDLSTVKIPVVVSGANYKAPYPTGATSVVTKSIGQMRLLSVADASVLYQINDTGRRGVFYYDSSDITTPDNDGTVLVAGTKRFKRIFSGAVRLSWFGADGTGVSDSTAAIQAALNTGFPVESEHTGKTYLTGPLTQTTPGQVIDLSGDTIKLKASSSAYQISLNGTGAQLRGGTFDGNKAAGQTTSTSYYNHAGIYLGAHYVKVIGATTINSIGIGIKAGAFDYLSIQECIVQSFNVQGIFVEGVGRDCFGNRIERNKVFCTAGTGVGIYLKGDTNAALYFQKKFYVNFNTVVGPAASSTTADVCITVRGIEGEVIGNTTTGGDMGISCDITTDSVISHNNIDATNGPTGYGIEVNGSNNTLNGNYIRRTIFGIVGSGATRVMDNNTISANEFIEQTTYGIFFQPTSTNTARYLSISGNTFTRTGTGTWNAIRLIGDCKYSKGHNNTIVGPGVAVGNSRALFLDRVNSNINFNFNTISGVERPMSVYNTDATPYTNITFNHNNCEGEAGISEGNFLVTEGAAVFGNYCQQIGNNTSTGRGTDYVDKAANVFARYGTGSPESAVTANIGSLFIRKDGGSGTVLYIKESGTGNTGWTAMTGGDVTINTGASFVRNYTNGSTGTSANLFINLINGDGNTAGLRYESSTNGSNPNRLQIVNGANAPISMAISGVEVFKIPTAGGLLTLSGYAGTGTSPLLVDGNGQLTRNTSTITAAGTTGPQTINRPSGQVNFAAGSSSLVVTNSLVTVNSLVFVQVLGTDATALYARVTKANGSFTINLNTTATAETAVEFHVQ